MTLLHLSGAERAESPERELNTGSDNQKSSVRVNGNQNFHLPERSPSFGIRFFASGVQQNGYPPIKVV